MSLKDIAIGISENIKLPDVVDIGKWIPYTEWADADQIRLQKEFLFDTGISNGQGSVKFIMSKHLNNLEKKLEELSRAVKIKDTTVTLIDEVFYTSKIEGAKTTRYRTAQIHAGEFLDMNNYKSEKMIHNGFCATKMLSVYGNRITKDILIDVWDVLTTDVCENLAVRGPRFRNGDVRVGSYVPVSYPELEQLMTDFCAFYNSKAMNEYPFVKAALIHFLFETIHPFCDGNGRLGRMLMNNYLIRNGVESARAVSFSMAIDADRPHYDVAFVDAENALCDCTPFLEFMLQTMYVAYSNVLKTQNEGGSK